MTLVLNIENYDYLDDGGPVQFTVTQRGCQVGRSNSMDWVLPDPSRHISSQHFEVFFQDGHYWLRDVSTNGTFLQGQRYRLDQPHQLSHMDRFHVGQYIISASLQAGVNPALPQAQSVPHAAAPEPWAGQASDADPWDLGGAADPINPLPADPYARREDFADDFIANPVFEQPAPLAPPPAAPIPEPLAAPTPQPAPAVPPQPAPTLTPPSLEAAAHVPGLSLPPTVLPEIPPVAPAPRPDVSQIPRPMPQPERSAPNTANSNDAVLKAFCEGAGLRPEAYGDVDPVELARSMGETLRIVSAEVMAQLQARASAKQFTRGGERTMRRASDNNPLKFLPDPDQAIEAMFLKHRAGFLNGADGLQEALRDLRMHQVAVFAAIQPALAELLNDLAPEVIEKDSGGGVLGGGKRAKAWDTFVERWDTKTSKHENGILDEFLVHFARAYADMAGSDLG